jgi:hypothetical protein
MKTQPVADNDREDGESTKHAIFLSRISDSHGDEYEVF